MPSSKQPDTLLLLSETAGNETDPNRSDDESSNESSEIVHDVDDVDVAILAGKEHNDLLAKAEGRTDEAELRKLVERFEHLEGLDENGSTVLHLISERWQSGLGPLFGVLMERYPGLFLLSDNLGRTVLDRDRSTRRPSFVAFFVKSYLTQTKDLIEGQNILLAFLLSELRDPECWKLLLPEIGHLLDKTYEKGNTFLHLAIIESNLRNDCCLTLIVTETVYAAPNTIEMLNSDGRSAYRCIWQRSRKVLNLSSNRMFSKRKLQLRTVESRPYAATNFRSGGNVGSFDNNDEVHTALKILKEVGYILRQETYKRMNGIKCRQLLYEIGAGV